MILELALFDNLSSSLAMTVFWDIQRRCCPNVAKGSDSELELHIVCLLNSLSRSANLSLVCRDRWYIGLHDGTLQVQIGDP